MKIVVVDGFAMNPGDLDWAPLRGLGECSVYDRTAPSELAARAEGATAVLTNKAPLRESIIRQLPSLRYIGVTATGYDVVDAAAAAAAGIVVTNVPAYSTASVTQVAFAHVMNLALQYSRLAAETSRGRWSSAPDFSFWDTPMIELAGKRMGIVGLGRIGRSVAHVAEGYGMEVVACGGRPISPLPVGVREVSQEELFRTSDVVTLHCPLTPATANLINATRLAMMKPTAWLINTGRGGLIDERALAEALAGGRIAGAGLDVLSHEPPPSDHPLLHAPRCFITPHVGWATVEARQRLLHETVENLRAFQRGGRRNVVAG